MKDLYEFFVDEYSKVQAVPNDLWQTFPKYVSGCADKLSENLPLWVEAYQKSGRFAPAAVTFLDGKFWLRKPPASWTQGSAPKSAMEGIE